MDKNIQTLRLPENWSSLKARKARDKRLRIWIAIGLFLVMIIWCFGPLFIANSILFTLWLVILTMTILRIWACIYILSHKHASPPPKIDSDMLPKFTVLVPLYKEANMIPSLTHHLKQLNYPRDKLDIVLITEVDDFKTHRAIQMHKCRQILHFIAPDGSPRTKPRALNAALNAISPDKRGDIITVYDAEDRPHPNQLKQAARHLQNDPSLVAVQAPLSYHNAHQNFLTKLFQIEYTTLFEVWNPALAKLGLIFTLGGTSNHINGLM